MMIYAGVQSTGGEPDPQPRLHVVAPSDPICDLTARELQVLELVAAGHSNRAIREQLHIAAGTLERHIRNIFLKLDLVGEEGTNSRVRATLMWLESPCGARKR